MRRPGWGHDDSLPVEVRTFTEPGAVNSILPLGQAPAVFRAPPWLTNLRNRF